MPLGGKDTDHVHACHRLILTASSVPLKGAQNFNQVPHFKTLLGKLKTTPPHTHTRTRSLPPFNCRDRQLGQDVGSRLWCLLTIIIKVTKVGDHSLCTQDIVMIYHDRWLWRDRPCSMPNLDFYFCLFYDSWFSHIIYNLNDVDSDDHDSFFCFFGCMACLI